MTNIDSARSRSPKFRRAAPGLPVVAMIGLALLAAPRVVLHDLDLISEGGLLNALFAFLPPLIWITVVLWKRVSKPFLTLLVVGVFYGVFLALGHQLLWTVSLGDSPPRLGGNLANLDPVVQSVILRFFAVISSLLTGVIVGAITGLIAWGINAFARRSPGPAGEG